MNLIEIGKRIQETKPLTTETALQLNTSVAAVFGKANPLALDDRGFPQMIGCELNNHVGGTIRRIGEMQAKAEEAGRVTPQALEAVAKLNAAITDIIGL
jgi:hypothetical protein